MSDDTHGETLDGVWPALPIAEWQATRDTLQLLTQIVGKIRMVRTPLMSHWWNVPLYVTARGLTTSMIPAGGRGFQIDFDFTTHDLDITISNGERRSFPLEARPVADFYAELMAMLDDLDLTTPIWTMPVEIPGEVIPFDKDDVHTSYDRGQVERFWRALVEMARVFELFRSEFVGKVSPVHLFWGGLDLAVTRFSGRRAPPHPGGAPNCGPHVMLEAYSHEVSSAGYWPGPDGEGVFYSYAYPEPDGYRRQPVAPSSAHFDDALGEFVLPYETVRTASDPDAVLLEFLRTTYAAAADTGRWDREELER
ncbi:MAG TPA: DUF5996 family protein [Ilumatobacteraceae bacterium]|nr:DUF5996 family protein [Ilumatobacteraceae bacterium]